MTLNRIDGHNRIISNNFEVTMENKSKVVDSSKKST